MTNTFLLCFLANSKIASILATFDAKQVIVIRLSLYLDIKLSIVFLTSFSDPISSCTNTFVESHNKQLIPSFPISCSLSESTLSPINGVSSIFQSPVWKTDPPGVFTYSPHAPSIECDNDINSTVNWSTNTGIRGETGTILLLLYCNLLLFLYLLFFVFAYRHCHKNQ